MRHIRKHIHGLTKYLVLLAIAVMTSLAVYADEPGASEEGPDGAATDGTLGNEAVPLDGGISLLLAGGIAYCAKKIHEAKKKQVKKHKEQADV